MSRTWDVLHDAGVIAVCHSEVAPAAGAAFGAVFTMQEQTRWCWVACAAMALTQLGARPVPAQCELASLRCREDCCAAPERCNQPRPFIDVQPFLQMLHIEAEYLTPSPLPLPDLIEEVLVGRPVLLGYENPCSPPGTSCCSSAMT